MIPVTVTCSVKYDNATMAYNTTLTVITNETHTERKVILIDIFKRSQFEQMYKMVMERAYKELMDALPER